MPWYRQVWPWILIALPASAVLASIATLIIAAADPDSLVVDDYYREGLAINRDLARARTAARLGLQGTLTMKANGLISVEIANAARSAGPLTLRLLHPARAHKDRKVLLYPAAGGLFTGVLGDLPTAARWRLLLAPADANWRLSGELMQPPSSAPLTAG